MYCLDVSTKRRHCVQESMRVGCGRAKNDIQVTIIALLRSSVPLSCVAMLPELHMFPAPHPQNVLQMPLPPRIDPTVTMMTVEEKPDVTYDDVGGAKDSLEKLREVVELPLLHPERFVKLGIDPPKVLCDRAYIIHLPTYLPTYLPIHTSIHGCIQPTNQPTNQP